MTDRNEDIFESTRMSLGEHLDELRSALLRSIYGFLVALVICLIFGKHIFNFLSQPLLLILEAHGLNPQIVTTSLPEFFLTYLKICLVAAIFLASPWIFWHIWGFVAAGLYPQEKRFVQRFVPFSAALFITGGGFFVMVVAPICFDFFITFATAFERPDSDPNPLTAWVMSRITQNLPDNTPVDPVNPPAEPSPTQKLILDLPMGMSLTWDTGRPIPPDEIATQAKPAPHASPAQQSLIQFLPKANEYLALVLLLSLAFSIGFQMPLAVFMLGRLGLVTTRQLRAGRKFAFLGILVASALITPPDIVSQVALTLPMFLLYEVGILMLQLWPGRFGPVAR